MLTHLQCALGWGRIPGRRRRLCCCALHIWTVGERTQEALIQGQYVDTHATNGLYAPFVLEYLNCLTKRVSRSPELVFELDQGGQRASGRNLSVVDTGS